MRLALGVLALSVCMTMSPAEARRYDQNPWQQHHWQSQVWYAPWDRPTVKHKAQRKHAKKRVRHARVRHTDNRLVTVPTAAGIRITVSRSFEPKITGFIADLVERGYKPKQITCYVPGRGRVAGSRHYSGNACDFDQRAWGRTAPMMYRVSALAKKHGLRDGGSFTDYGHIDDGKRLSRTARRHQHPGGHHAQASIYRPLAP